MNLRFFLEKPHLIIPRVSYWIWEKRNPDKPWLCPGSIRFLEKTLSKQMNGVEFGSGRSTVWFSRQLGHVVSVEHAVEWYNKIKADLESAGISNVDYRLIPLDQPESEPEQENYAVLPAYVRVLDSFADNSLDFIFVDGHYRTTCVKQSLAKLKPGGLLFVDDINLWPSVQAVPVPAGWQIVDDSTNGLKHAIIWKKPAA